MRLSSVVSLTLTHATVYSDNTAPAVGPAQPLGSRGVHPWGLWGLSLEYAHRY